LPNHQPDPAVPAKRGLWAAWTRSPLYLRMIAAVIVGALVGLAIQRYVTSLGLEPSDAEQKTKAIASYFGQPASLILRMLATIAAPLILFAVIHALVSTNIRGRSGVHLIWLLLTNTLAAIGIGLLVANILQPGAHSDIDLGVSELKVIGGDKTPLQQFLENVPRSVLGPLAEEGKIIGVVILALLFGFALRTMRNHPRFQLVRDLLEIGLQTLIVILLWIVEILPFGILGVVADKVAVFGFDAFRPLGYFVVAVLVALALQVAFYLTRIRFGSWARPLFVLRGMRDALVMAFSTASSTATMPVTYEHLRTRVGLREESASLGAMVGANFNNDGTALYEAMAALFVSQLLGIDLSLDQQFTVVLMSVIASVGAAGIPEAGLVTMTLVFQAVGLPVEHIAMLLVVDWFLDRCRTMVNVMGDVTVSCVLDGRIREEISPPAPATTQ
jgi:DAACS family dicarboxylate/amino acid:cation (Na+ or H+) symporter